MTPAEQKLFFLPEENLFRALARCLACLTPTTSFPETLAAVAPALTGEQRELFLLALHSLAREADRNPLDVAEVFALSGEIFRILEESTITATDDDAAEFVEGIKDIILPIYVASGQLVKNWKQDTSMSK